MAIKKYYDSDCNLGVLDGKTVAVIGFGSPCNASGFARGSPTRGAVEPKARLRG